MALFFIPNQMKKIILAALLLCNIVAFSQNEIAKKVNKLIETNKYFEPFSVFKNQQLVVNKDINDVVANATILEINNVEINKIVSLKPEFLELTIPFQNKSVAVQLYKTDIFAENFHIDTNKSSNIGYEKGCYYRGIVKNDSKSVVSFNFFRNECNGIISNDDFGNLVIGKLNTPGNETQYIVYSDADLKVLNSFECHTKESEGVHETPEKNTTESTLSARCVTFYFEVDYNIFQQNNSNVTTTTNWMTSVFNNVQTLYNNDGITVSLKSMYIWTTPDSYSGSGSSDYLFQFNALRPIFDGDVGQLIGIDPGGLGGVAVTINGLCSNNNFSYSDVDISYSAVPTFSWTVQVITHEFGHLLGSRHTHSCSWNGNNTAIDNCAPFALGASWEGGSCMTTPPTIPAKPVKGTIMSYCHLVSGVGIKFANGFGPQPKDAILNTVNAANCLSTDCINTCINNVTSIEAINVGETSATIHWTETLGTFSDQVAVTSLDGNPTNWFTSPTNDYLADGLTANTYYKAFVRKNCSGGLEGPLNTKIFATAGDFCSGITLTDTGGLTGDYKDYENITRIIIPTNPNAKAKITFTAFDLELDYDYLHIYNGHDSSFPELSPGLGFTGTTIPEPIESTADDGALTLNFYSDGGVIAPGYIATISCLTLGVSNLSPSIDFSYAPNPTTSEVVIHSKTQMEEVLVYNIQGRLLLRKSIKNLDAIVDMADFAKGTYFFKLKFDNQESNFKILKQ